MRYPVLNLEDWAKYQAEGLNADSLWLIDKNVTDDLHQNDLHGQFVAQLPRQLILRFTRPGDIVADPFMGRGTTGIEARRLGRHFMGVELVKERFEDATVRIQQANTDQSVQATVLCDDVMDLEWPEETLALTILHPPYHDIIKFSEDLRCWSNVTRDQFLLNLHTLAGRLLRATEIDGHLVLVMGDLWDGSTSAWYPLGFECMRACQDQGWQLRGIVVKNQSGNTKGKGNGRDGNLKYYRCLKSRTFRFAHEYLFVYRRVGK